MRRLILLLFLCVPALFGYSSYSGFCEQGGQKITVAGQSPVAYLQQSYPNFTQSGAGPSVTIYFTGTTIKAPVFSDNSGTVKDNPFPCSGTGQFQFWSSSDTIDILFSGSGVSSFTRASVGGSSLNVYANFFGAFADAAGATGTNQSTAVQGGINFLSSAGGGVLVFPAAPLCYSLGPTVTVPSNVSVQISAGACVQKLHGSANGPVFQLGSETGATSNIHIMGGGTIDGNKANISFSGDGFQQGVYVAGASNASVSGLNIINAPTDGVYVGCWGNPETGEGDGIVIENNLVDGSKRNNIVATCSTHITIRNNVSRNAGGGSLSDGIDIEPFVSGQSVNGIAIYGNQIYGNDDDCIDLKMPFEAAGSSAYVGPNNCYSNSGPVSLLTLGSGNLTILGGWYSGGSTAAISAQGWASVSAAGENALNSVRGFLVSGNSPNVRLGPGYLNGSSWDISCDYASGSRCIMAGVTLANGIEQAGSNALYEMIVNPSNSAQYGIPWWTGNNPRDGQFTSSVHVQVCPTDTTLPCILVNDQLGNVVKMQTINGSGVFVGSQNNVPLILGANNVQSPGTKGNWTLYPNGTLRIGPSDSVSVGTCNTANGDRVARVHDSTTQTWGATYTGGGSDQAGIICDGSNWTVFSK